MFPSRVDAYLDDDLLGTSRTHAETSFDRDHPLFQRIQRLNQLATSHPALRNGAHQHRYASDEAGIYAFSRLHRGQMREYVVALNNSLKPQTAAIPTYVRRGQFVRVYGQGEDTVRSGAARRLRLTVPALSTVVYRSARPIPRSDNAPRVGLRQVRPSAGSNSRMRVAARVGGASFNEVTFYARVGDGRWRAVGTDDTRPYRVFHDVSSRRTGARLTYRAVVRDNAGHERVSAPRRALVPAPRITIEAPDEDADVFGTIQIRATVDPERAIHVVRFQRSLDGGAWRRIGTDSSSPVYTDADDLTAVPVGTVVRYRAVLVEPDGSRTVSATRTVTRTNPKPLVDTVTVAGSLQSEVGCPGDWDPACADSQLTFDPEDGMWRGTFVITPGSYEYKVAIDGSWEVNYGAGGAFNGSNIVLEVPAGATGVTFVWNQETHVVTHNVND
jgi:hypothetical protein